MGEGSSRRRPRYPSHHERRLDALPLGTGIRPAHEFHLRDPDGYLPLLAEYVDQHANLKDVETEGRAQVDKAKSAA